MLLFLRVGRKLVGFLDGICTASTLIQPNIQSGNIEYSGEGVRSVIISKVVCWMGD